MTGSLSLLILYATGGCCVFVWLSSLCWLCMWSVVLCRINGFGERVDKVDERIGELNWRFVVRIVVVVTVGAVVIVVVVVLMREDMVVAGGGGYIRVLGGGNRAELYILGIFWQAILHLY